MHEGFAVFQVADCVILHVCVIGLACVRKLQRMVPMDPVPAPHVLPVTAVTDFIANMNPLRSIWNRPGLQRNPSPRGAGGGWHWVRRKAEV